MVQMISSLNDIKKIFEGIKTPIFYITNAADHGVGLENIIPNYHIVCIDHDDEVDYLEKSGAKIFCLEKKLGKKNIIFRSSAILLAQESVKNYIKENTPPGEQVAIVVFKPSLATEKIAAENDWKILNNQTGISKEIEDKLNFVFIAKSLGIRIPDAETIDLGRISYWELKKYYDYFVVQLKSGYTGKTTFFIRNNDDYVRFINNFFRDPSKKISLPVKVSKFIKGAAVTVNACVTSNGIFAGKPCFQITGEELCTNNLGTTCGNDWGVLSFSEKSLFEINSTVQKIGEYIKNKGYKGIFGLDFIISEKNEDVSLIEINPRFVASIPFFTKLELKNSIFPLLALHYLEFLGVKFNIDSSAKELLEKNSRAILGAQLVLRNKYPKASAPANEVKSGVYSLEGGELKFLREGYSSLDIEMPEEFVVLTAAKGRKIKPESEAARVESLRSLVSPEQHLTAEAEMIAKNIYSKLNLKPV